MTREWLENRTASDINLSLEFIPKAKDRAAWEGIPQNIKDEKIKEAEGYLSFSFEGLTATDFLLFKREGNRTVYENKSLKKRDALSALVIGECLEYKGRFTDAIINGIWSLCEESFWGVPAHNDGKALPDVNEPIIDIFAAQTAGTVTLAAYVLADELTAVSPQITQRVQYEVEKRILTPFAESTSFWWMGYYRKDINNWNPWILSNIIYPILIYKKFELVDKALYVLDAFLNYCSDEGSCDEGMTYWNVGALCMFEFLETLYRSSGGTIDFYGNAKVRNCLVFILKMYIGGGQFVNFADAAPLTPINFATVYRVGTRLGDDEIKALAAELYANRSEKNKSEYLALKRDIFDLFAYADLLGTQPLNAKSAYYYMSDIQVLTFKNEKHFVAIKGGSNGENHNHNDVGSFIFYSDEKPVIIDIGAPFYDARSFSDRRYEIFSNQSAYHNLPIVNGSQQQAGSEHRAEEFSAKKYCVSMKLDSCYGEKCSRTFDYRNEHLYITDTFDNAEVHTCFICAAEPQQTDGGVKVNGTKILCRAPHKLKAEKIVLDDLRLKNSWGDAIWRVIFSFENANKTEFEIGE